MIARSHEAGLVDFLEKLIPRAGVWLEPGITPCVKTHTSKKCEKYNSPTRDRVICAQYDLTLAVRNRFENFTHAAPLWSFHAAWVIDSISCIDGILRHRQWSAGNEQSANIRPSRVASVSHGTAGNLRNPLESGGFVLCSLATRAENDKRRLSL